MKRKLHSLKIELRITDPSKDDYYRFVISAYVNDQVNQTIRMIPKDDFVSLYSIAMDCLSSQLGEYVERLEEEDEQDTNT